MPSEPLLNAIELANFQSISKRSRIDFRDLTLLYGPNSAGKSALNDALELGKAISKIGPDWAEVSQMVDRWASRIPTEDNLKYRETQEALGLRPSKYRTLSLGFEVSFSFDDPCDDRQAFGLRPDRVGKIGGWLNVENDLDDPLSCDWPRGVAQIEFTVSLQDGVTANSGSLIFNNFKINVRGRPLIEIYNKGRDWNPEADDSILRVYDSWLYDIGIPESDVPEEKTSKLGTTPYYEIDVRPVCRLGSLAAEDDSWAFVNGEKLIDTGEEIIRYFLSLLHFCLIGGPPLVPADRRIPYSRLNLSEVNLDYTSHWWTNSESSPVAPLKNLTSQRVDEDFYVSKLALLTHCHSLRQAINSKEWGSDWAREKFSKLGKFDYEQNASQLDQINKYLSEDLFSDRLYQLKGSSILMVPLDIEVDDPYNSYYILAQPALTSLYLVDGSGGRVELRDVGSGIPFILPVLLAMTESGYKFIQQPELHLHPALQSALADVFIRQIKATVGPSIIETHSEHLLLRVLRRIRETTAGKLLDESLSLSVDEVSVYYFDPQVSGETRVIRIHLTPTGDFRNRWPKGFFEERSTDLFDNND